MWILRELAALAVITLFCGTIIIGSAIYISRDDLTADGRYIKKSTACDRWPAGQCKVVRR